MKIEPFTFKITGLSPLLMHNPAHMTTVTEPGLGHKRRYPTAEAQAESYLYLDNKGHFVFPASAFRNALLYAVGGKKVGKKSGRAVVSASVFNSDDQPFVILIDPKTEKPLKKYTVDTRSVVVQGARVIRSRPKFDIWACFLPLAIDTELITAGIVLDNMIESGRIAGVGDFRVEKRGWFGRYTAELL